MIIEELKSFLRATVLISTDMNKKEFALELLEKIIAMEQKLKAMEPIVIDPPITDLPAGEIKPRPPWHYPPGVRAGPSGTSSGHFGPSHSPGDAVLTDGTIMTNAP